MQMFRNVIVVFAMLVSSVCVLAQNATSFERDDEPYRRAEDLFRKGKYAAAQHQFDLLVAQAGSERSSRVADAVYYAAVCSEELGNGDAMYRLEEFLRLYPESSHANMAHFYEGNCLYAKGDYAAALKKYQKVTASEVTFGPRDEVEYKCGYCHLNAGNRDKAKSCFSHIMNGKSKYKDNALYYYAHIQYMDGDYAQSLKNFQKIESNTKASPKLAKIAKNYIARIYYYLGREDEFLEMAPSLMQDKDAFKKDDLQQMMGEVYFNRGEYTQALKYYRLAEQTAAQGQGQQSQRKSSKKNKDGEMVAIQGCVPNDNTYQTGYCHYMLGNYDSAAVYLAKKTTCDDSVAQNALYTLADTYLKLGRKQDARAMFLQASKMSYNAKIQEDALFNYAKLSCDLNQNAYNESIKSFESYLRQYPRTKHKAEIQEILTSLYFSTRNYKDALALIEKVEPRTAEMNHAYQRLLINRGIELFNERNVKQAYKMFQNAVKVNADVQRTADALYLSAEAQYRLDNISGAKKALDRFFLNSKAPQSAYYGQALYTYGYVCMDNEAYADGATYFSRFIQRDAAKVDVGQLCDAYNRLADCQYGQKQFTQAIKNYDYVVDHNGKDADYATYQKALAYGAIGKSEEKLVYLNRIFENYAGSPLASKAIFEMANTYLVCDNNEMALLYFDKFLKQYPQSAYVKEALLNKGLIYYNTNRNRQALDCFEELITKYQGTEEARDALVTVKNIYIAENRVDDYFAYVRNNTKMVISSAEQDSITFSVAANRYYEGDYDNAIPSLQNYLRQFPEGLSSLNAHYYLADCLFRTGQSEKALPHYEAVVQRNKNQYTETSLYNAANIAYSLNNYTKALEHYASLASLAEADNSRIQARTGVLRCWNMLDNHRNIILAGDALLKESKITDELRDEALISMARSYYKNNQFDSASGCYTQLKESPNGEYSGEAVYRLTEALHLSGDDAAAEKAIENIIANPPSDYWLAKTFILWADIFYAQGNSLQAKQTLQSIIDNYESDHSQAADDLINLALEKRNAILLAEAQSSQQEEDAQSQEVQVEIPLPESSDDNTAPADGDSHSDAANNENE